MHAYMHVGMQVQLPLPEKNIFHSPICIYIYIYIYVVPCCIHVCNQDQTSDLLDPLIHLKIKRASVAAACSSTYVVKEIWVGPIYILSSETNTGHCNHPKLNFL